METAKDPVRNVTLEDRHPAAWVAGFVAPGIPFTLTVLAFFMPVPRQNVLAMAAITAIFVYLGNRSMKHTTFTVTNTTLTITEPLRKPTAIPLDSINSYYLGDNYLTFDFQYRSWRSRRQKTQFSHINYGTLLTIVTDTGWTYGIRSRETHNIADEIAQRIDKMPTCS